MPIDKDGLSRYLYYCRYEKECKRETCIGDFTRIDFPEWQSMRRDLRRESRRQKRKKFKSLGFEPRVAMFLVLAGFSTLEEIQENSIDDLAIRRNIGKKTIDSIIRVMSEHGRNLKASSKKSQYEYKKELSHARKIINALKHFLSQNKIESAILASEEITRELEWIAKEFPEECR